MAIINNLGIVYHQYCYFSGKESEVDVSLNHNVIASFSFHSDPKLQNLGPTWPLEWYKSAPIACETAHQYLKHFECVQYGCGKQSEVDIILNHQVSTPQMSKSSKSVANLAGGTICHRPWHCGGKHILLNVTIC
jgi:hypothetical protein